jgi:hypothetical protein
MAPTVFDGLVFVGASGSQGGIRGFLAVCVVAQVPAGPLTFLFYEARGM